MSKQDYKPPSKLTVALIIAAVFAIGVGVYSPAKADIYLETSLGSMVGEKRGHVGTMPFFGELCVQEGYKLACIGHQSNSDLNGNETAGEYLGAGIELTKGKLFGRLMASEYVSGDLDELYTLSAGVQQSGFKFGGIYRQDTDANYKMSAVMAGYRFEF